VYADIQRALFAHVDALAQTRGYAVAWPGVDFNPEASQYLEVYALPAAAQTIGFSTLNRIPGLLQVDCVYRTGAGVLVGATLADDVINHFPRGLRLTAGAYRVNVDAAAWASPEVANGRDWIKTPVSIPFVVLT
jgi:hypothetical protein